MPIAPALAEMLICPVSQQPLRQQGEALLTTDRQRRYPIINGIPWLLPNPENALADWRAKLNHFNQVLLAECQRLEQQLGTAVGASRPRLERLLQGKHGLIRRVSELLYPLVTAEAGNKNIYDTLRDRAPSTQNLLSYEANLYRDWVWGEEENRLTAAIVLEHLQDLQAKKMLVLGAGAGRLALDVHVGNHSALTVAADINPLLVMAASHLLTGQSLNFYEFPQQPRSSQYVAIEHQIAGQKKPDNFHWVFSDAAKPCFQPGCFDAVLTPWLIDIQPLALGRFLRQLNQYLPEGGYWINFGSLVFHQQRDALCYTADEIQAIAKEQGFELERTEAHEIPYLQSPYNAGYRMERVWSWTARKVHSVAALVDPQVLPPWVLDPRQPIPKHGFMQQFVFTHRTYAHLAAEVDGKRSMAKIARKVAKQNRLDEQEALAMVTSFFIDLVQQNS